MTIQPRSEQDAERPTLLVHNDSASPWRGEVMISRRRTVGGGEPLGQQQVSFDLEPRSATAIMINDDVLSPLDGLAGVPGCPGRVGGSRLLVLRGGPAA